MDCDTDTEITGNVNTEAGMINDESSITTYSQCNLCPNGHRCTPGVKNYSNSTIRISVETQTEPAGAGEEQDNVGDIDEALNKIKTLSRKELEEMITKCLIGTINSHADMKSLREKCKDLNTIKDRLFHKSIMLQKQVNDMTVAIRQMTDNMNRNPKLRGSSAPAPAPIRFFRDIGFQVGIPDPKPTGKLYVRGPKYHKFVNMRQSPISSTSRRPKKKPVDVDVVKQQMKDITNDTVLLQNSTNNNANFVQNQEVDSSKSSFLSAAVKVRQNQQKQPRNYSPVNNYLNISTSTSTELMPPPPRPIGSRPRQVYIRQPRPAQQYVNNNLRQVLLQKQQQQLPQQNQQQQQTKIENLNLDNIVEITETDQIITQNQGQLVYGENGELQLIAKPLEVDLDSQNLTEGQSQGLQVVSNLPRLQLIQQRTQQQQQQQPQTSQDGFTRTNVFRLLPKLTTTAGIRSSLATTTASGQIRHINVIRMGQSGSLQQHRFLHPGSIRPKFSLPPFPPPPVALPQKNNSNKRGNHLLPPKPELILKIHEADPGVIVLSWNCTLSNNAEINIYQLYACQEAISENLNQQNPPLCTQWKSMGEVKALPLPMGCNISQISGNSKHHFIVRGIDVYNRAGEFSDPKSIILNRKV